MKEKLFNFDIDILNFDEALKEAIALIESNKPAQIITINPEMFFEAEKNSEFANVINKAEMIIPDGVGVKIALKINGIEATRIPGIDFARKILDISAEKKYSIAIIGAKEDVINKAVQNLEAEIPNINIVYWHNGYFNNDEEIYSELKEKNPEIILVAMGAPKQEIFINNAKKILTRGLMIGIGGSLDVWAGNVKRAPKVFRLTGTEWIYRTILQPERFKRIFPALPLFLIKAFKYKFHNRQK